MICMYSFLSMSSSKVKVTISTTCHLNKQNYIQFNICHVRSTTSFRKNYGHSCHFGTLPAFSPSTSPLLASILPTQHRDAYTGPAHMVLQVWSFLLQFLLECRTFKKGQVRVHVPRILHQQERHPNKIFLPSLNLINHSFQHSVFSVLNVTHVRQRTPFLAHYVPRTCQQLRNIVFVK